MPSQISSLALEVSTACDKVLRQRGPSLAHFPVSSHDSCHFQWLITLTACVDLFQVCYSSTLQWFLAMAIPPAPKSVVSLLINPKVAQNFLKGGKMMGGGGGLCVRFLRTFSVLICIHVSQFGFFNASFLSFGSVIRTHEKLIVCSEFAWAWHTKSKLINQATKSLMWKPHSKLVRVTLDLPLFLDLCFFLSLSGSCASVYLRWLYQSFQPSITQTAKASEMQSHLQWPLFCYGFHI